MNRLLFDQIVRAAVIGGTADTRVSGSQSILGSHPEIELPDEIVGSVDLDIEPTGATEDISK